MTEIITQKAPAETGAAATEPQRTLPELPADAMIIVPVRNFVMFPDVVMPLTLGRPASTNAAQAAVRESRPVGILTQRDPELKDVATVDMHHMGTVANLLRYITGPDETNHLIVQGETRFRVLEFLDGWPFMVARIELITEPEAKTTEIEARFINLRQSALETVQLLPQAPQGLTEAIHSPAVITERRLTPARSTDEMAFATTP